MAFALSALKAARVQPGTTGLLCLWWGHRLTPFLRGRHRSFQKEGGSFGGALCSLVRIPLDCTLPYPAFCLEASIGRSSLFTCCLWMNLCAYPLTLKRIEHLLLTEKLAAAQPDIPV